MDRGLFDGLDLLCILWSATFTILYVAMRLDRNDWRRIARTARDESEAWYRRWKRDAGNGVSKLRIEHTNYAPLDRVTGKPTRDLMTAVRLVYSDIIRTLR
jgi:hypothetical protein